MIRSWQRHRAVRANGSVAIPRESYPFSKFLLPPSYRAFMSLPHYHSQYRIQLPSSPSGRIRCTDAKRVPQSCERILSRNSHHLPKVFEVVISTGTNLADHNVIENFRVEIEASEQAGVEKLLCPWKNLHRHATRNKFFVAARRETHGTSYGLVLLFYSLLFQTLARDLLLDYHPRQKPAEKIISDVFRWM